jgi:2,3-dihydroxybiphenyl 1,2-dioxygenase
MSIVLRLGYLGLEVSDLDAWENFGRELVGMHLERHGADLLTARLDEHARRFIFTRGARDDLAYAGWEVSDRPALEALATALSGAGYTVEQGTTEAAQARGVDAFVRFKDRADNPLELFCAPAHAAPPWRSASLKSGFVTGGKGLGHYVAGHPDLAAARALYCDLLGLRVSDYIFLPGPDGRPVRAMFLHANARHHSVALVEIPLPQKIDHFFVQLQDFEDLGRAYDRFIDSPFAIRNSLGQHPNDHAISFYAETPSRFAVEIGWSDFDLNEDGWSTCTYDRTSLWGHRPRKP